MAIDLDSTIEVSPVASRVIDWSPGLIRAAELSADCGNLSLAADLCEYLLGDDRIRAVTDTRIGALIGLPLSFEASGDGRKSKKVIRALEAEEDFWAMCPESELKSLHRWVLMLGVGVAQLHWTESSGRLLPVLQTWSPRHLSFDFEARQWLVTVQDGKRTTKKIPATPGKWVIATPAGADRPWANGAYRSLARFSYLKQAAIRDWGLLSERLGQGIKTVKTPAGLTRDQRNQIVADIRGLSSNAVLALPEGYSLEILEAKYASQDSFRQQIDAADKAFATTILGQVLTTSAANGASSVATTHADTQMSRIREDAECFSTVLHDQVLRPWAEVNFRNANLAPWPVRDTKDATRTKAEADAVMQALQGISQAANTGVADLIDIPELLRRFNIPVKGNA